MFGGCSNWKRGKTDDAHQKLAKTTVLEFGEQNTFAMLTSFGTLASGFNFSSSTSY